MDTPGDRFPGAESVSAGEVAERVAPRSRIRRVTPGDLGVNTHALAGGGVSVQVVNYGLDPQTSTFRRVEGVVLALPDTAGPVCRLVRPGEPDRPLDVARGSAGNTVTLPFVDGHAVLVL